MYKYFNVCNVLQIFLFATYLKDIMSNKCSPHKCKTNPHYIKNTIITKKQIEQSLSSIFFPLISINVCIVVSFIISTLFEYRGTRLNPPNAIQVFFVAAHFKLPFLNVM